MRREPVFRTRRPDWSVCPQPDVADSVRDALEGTDCPRHSTWRDCAVAGCPPPAGHRCGGNLALPMAPWLLAQAVRRVWRKLAGRAERNLKAQR